MNNNILFFKDCSKIDPAILDITNIKYSINGMNFPTVNLGLYTEESDQNASELKTSYYCGIDWIRDKSNNKNEQILVVSPRFDSQIAFMVKEILNKTSIKDNFFYKKGNGKRKWILRVLGKDYITINLDKLESDEKRILDDFRETIQLLDQKHNQSQNIIMNTENNNHIKFLPFAIDLAQLFEFYASIFIENLLIENEDWRMVPRELSYKITDKNSYLEGNVEPDIVLQNNTDGCYIILDAKYKNSSRADREDRLQLLAYGYMFQAKIIGHIFPSIGNKKSRSTNLQIEDERETYIKGNDTFPFSDIVEINTKDGPGYCEIYITVKEKENQIE